MKKIALFLVAVAVFLGSAAVLRADHERIIAPEQLPAAAQAFIKQYFPEMSISYAKKEIDNMRTTYEARMNDGTEITFNSKGEWDKVDREFQPVPAALIPAEIAAYVQSHFPDTPVTKIDKERYGYDIELLNDLELKFSKNGRLINYDD